MWLCNSVLLKGHQLVPLNVWSSSGLIGAQASSWFSIHRLLNLSVIPPYFAGIKDIQCCLLSGLITLHPYHSHSVSQDCDQICSSRIRFGAVSRKILQLTLRGFSRQSSTLDCLQILLISASLLSTQAIADRRIACFFDRPLRASLLQSNRLCSIQKMFYFENRMCALLPSVLLLI